MFDSSIIGIIVGMVFFYLMLGLVCSVFGEAIAAALAWRAGNMYKGLKDIFFDPHGDVLVDKLYEHPLIQSARRPRWWDGVAKLGSKGAGKPNEISLTQFKIALEDTVRDLPSSDPRTRKVVETILSDDQQKSTEVWKAIESQLTARYEAKMLWLIVFLSIAIAAAANADSLMLFNALRTDKAIQAGVASAIAKMNADDIPASIEKMNQELRVLELFGWTKDPKDRRSIPATPVDWLTKVVGLLLTTVVVARTAPYAFDFFRYAVKLVEYKAKLSQPSPER